MERRTAADILIDRFLKDVDEKQKMPWQQPYRVFNAFNYVSKKPYTGFNRLILPFGEYLTANQINQINKEQGQDYKFKRGIEWYPITFFKKENVECSRKEVEEKAPGDCNLDRVGFLFRDYSWLYFLTEELTYVKSRSILRYYEVADIKWFINSKGENPPSKIQSNEVELCFSDAKDVYEGYANNSGIILDDTYKGVPSYVPSMDLVRLNKNISSVEEYYSTAFHEFAHSTGSSVRLNRNIMGEKGSDTYAKEECIAEITAGLCCSECQVYDVTTSESKSYDNSVAYVQAWKKRIKDWGKEFIYIVSQAEKAFNYIMSTAEAYVDDVVEEEE